MRPKRSRSSYVWKYFTENVDTSTVTCKLCQAVLKYNSNTSAMDNHLRMKHPLPTATVHGNDASHASTAASSSRQTTIDFSKRLMTDNRRRKITDLLVNFVVKDVRPISTLSGEGFKDIIQYFEPGYTIPCHHKVWSNIMHQYNTVRATIMDEMKDLSVSLTTDLWTSCTMDP